MILLDVLLCANFHKNKEALRNITHNKLFGKKIFHKFTRSGDRDDVTPRTTGHICGGSELKVVLGEWLQSRDSKMCGVTPAQLLRLIENKRKNIYIPVNCDVT